MMHVLQCCRNSRAGLRAGSSAVGGTIAISDSWSSGGFWGSRTMVLGMRWMKGMTGGGEGVSSTTGRRCDMEKERNWMDRNTFRLEHRLLHRPSLLFKLELVPFKLDFRASLKCPLDRIVHVRAQAYQAHERSLPFQDDLSLLGL